MVSIWLAASDVLTCNFADCKFEGVCCRSLSDKLQLRS